MSFPEMSTIPDLPIIPKLSKIPELPVLPSFDEELEVIKKGQVPKKIEVGRKGIWKWSSNADEQTRPRSYTGIQGVTGLRGAGLRGQTGIQGSSGFEGRTGLQGVTFASFQGTDESDWGSVKPLTFSICAVRQQTQKLVPQRLVIII